VATLNGDRHRASTAVAVEIVGLTKWYQTSDGTRLHSLDRIDLTIEAGTTVAVVGPSGCGKSTLLKIACGLIRPTAGQVRVGGAAVTRPRRDIGVAFQTADLLEWRTVRENIALGARLQRRDKAATVAAVDELLEVVGLTEFGDRYPHELSGGMQQRAALARALLIEPSVLLLDEPFGALDALTRERLNVELNRLCTDRAMTTLLITHSIDEAVFVADRVAVMSARPGQIVDSVDVALARPRALSCRSDPAFVAIAQHLRSHFVDEDRVR
jgi:NitT/TauT family transport system ATP-binding protein